MDLQASLKTSHLDVVNSNNWNMPKAEIMNISD
jgi:hypothetical protein